MLTGVAAGRHAPTISWRSQGEAYDERRLRAAEVELRGSVAELTFTLPPGQQCADFILLAAASVPGQYRVSRARAGGAEIEGFVARIMATDGNRLEPGAASVLVSHQLRPPRLELDARGLDCATLQVCVEREHGDVVHDAILSAVAEVARDQADAETRLIEAQLSHASRVGVLERRLHAAHQSQDSRADALEQQLHVAQTTLLDAFASADVSSRLASIMGQLEAAAAHESARADHLRHELTQLAESVRQVEESQLRQSVQLEAHGTVLARIVNGIENVFWRRWASRLRRLPK